VKANYSVSRLAELYVNNILKLHGAPKSIVSDRGPQFTAQFWKSLHASMGTELNYSTAFHSQTDDQIERVNQVLEDLLRACVLTYGSDWENNLSYVEFSYNNGYQASLRMAPYEALYGKRCRTPLMWSEVEERTFFGPATIVEAEENVAKVRENLNIAQSRQKSFANPKRKDVLSEVEERVYLKVSPL
jgi:transposase InsO family protein